MNRTIFRITNAFKFFFVALAKPELLKADTFKMMADLLAMIMKVSAERRPMMAHVAFLNVETENAPMISIWAGPGAHCSPLGRIDELLEENKRLKDALMQAGDKKQAEGI